MAIAFVAVTKLQSAAGAAASGAVSATAGNSLIVAGTMFNSGTWTVTRTGDTYTTDSNGSATAIGAGIASAPNVAGGSVSMTITCTSASGITGYAIEVSGLPSASIRDASSPALASGNSGTATTGSLTNVTADALYIAVVSIAQGINPVTMTPSGSWSDTAASVQMFEPNNATAQAADVVQQIVATTAARTSVWTVSSSNWTALIAVYKMAAGGATPPNVVSGPLHHATMRTTGGFRR